jgi:dCTP diphosphatase
MEGAASQGVASPFRGIRLFTIPTHFLASPPISFCFISQSDRFPTKLNSSMTQPTTQPLSDAAVTVAELKQWVDDFVDRRDWHQFHAPKNLAMSMAIEAAELMEHFQWLSVEESREVAKDPKRLVEVGEELADVLCYALAMANELGLELATTIRQKIAKNEKKYPAEAYKGRY